MMEGLDPTGADRDSIPNAAPPPAASLETASFGIDIVKNLFDPPAQLYSCDPLGNHTYLARAPRVTQDIYPQAHHEVLKRFPHFQQGGFLVPSQEESAVVRLEMSGGEFCINASLALAAQIAADYTERKLAPVAKFDKAALALDNSLTFTVEISGTDQLISAHVGRGVEGAWMTSVLLPLTDRVRQYEGSVFIAGADLPVKVVELEGISHFLVAGQRLSREQLAMPRTEMLRELIAAFGVAHHAAVGLMVYQDVNNDALIDPLVWVRDVDTYVAESACGSGSLALALMKAKEAGTPAFSFLVEQPSGENLQVMISRLGGSEGPLFALVEGIVYTHGDLNLNTSIRRDGLPGKSSAP